MSEIFSMPPAPAKTLLVLLPILALIIAPLVLLAYVTYSGGATRYEISDSGLRIRGTLYGRTVPWSDVVIDAVRRTDLSRERELQPTLRTNGVGLPGYRAGWFRLRNGRGLLFVTDPSRVVAIPTHRNYTLLLSVDRPDEFVRAVRQRG